WEHNFQRAMVVPEQSAVLLGLLMLRGPQTAGELRIHSERWYRFADTSSVEGFLDEMRDRGADKGGPLVVQLPRAPGSREARWAHRLCGPVDTSAPPAAAAAPPAAAPGPAPELAVLSTRVAALEMELAVLRAQVQDLSSQLGLSPPGQEEANDRA